MPAIRLGEQVYIVYSIVVVALVPHLQLNESLFTFKGTPYTRQKEPLQYAILCKTYHHFAINIIARLCGLLSGLKEREINSPQPKHADYWNR